MTECRLGPNVITAEDVQHIVPEEFDEEAAELARSLDHFAIPARERQEVLDAFAAHKAEVTEGSMTAMTP